MDTMMTPEQGAPYRSNRSAEIDKLAGSLAKAQGAMENAEKSAENPAFKRDGKASTYATLASVWSAIRKPLADNGLAVLQWPRTVEGGVEIETELLHESGQFMRDMLWLPCPQMTVHTVGSAITYGRRYSLMAIVGIAPEDDDGNGAVEGHKPGAAGSAGGGGQFRPETRRQSSWGPGGKQAVIAEAEADGLVDHTRKKGTLPAKPGPLGGRGATPEEARAAKLKAKTDERIDALKAEKRWTRERLDKFWNDNTAWREWMSDPANEALKEYERFTDAFLEAESNLKPVELA